MHFIRPYYLVRISIACVVLCVCALYTQNTVGAPNSHAVTLENTLSEPYTLLNVIWFKPDGGEAKYMEYLAAAAPIVAEYGGKVLDAFIPVMPLIGELNADLVFFVEWPNQEAFTDFVQDPDYQAISILRNKAIQDSLLIRCHRLAL